MTKTAKKHPLTLPFIIGVVLGIIAKLVDVPYITSELPVFDDIMGRFGIWVWAAALISVRSKTAHLAAARSFLFFAGMLTAFAAWNWNAKDKLLLLTAYICFSISLLAVIPQTENGYSA